MVIGGHEGCDLCLLAERVQARLAGKPMPEECRVRGCTNPATATVLVAAIRLPYCFTHEREYADRFGSADIYAIA